MAFTGTANATASLRGKSPVIVHTAVPLKDTEQSHTFAIGTKVFRLVALGLSALRISYVVNGTGATTDEWWDLPPGGEYSPPLDVDVSQAFTIYFRASKGSETVIIESWS